MCAPLWGCSGSSDCIFHRGQQQDSYSIVVLFLDEFSGKWFETDCVLFEIIGRNYLHLFLHSGAKAA